jgi:DNA (cytosine-5)-methyltransferase 1
MFTFVDLFSGIGGFRIALESLGGKCVGSSEIAGPAIKVYHDNWPEDDNVGDITKIEVLPEHDIMVGGVPCQSWSIAGKMKGFEDPRGQLWGDVIRLLNKNQPKAFIFENVKGLADPRNTVEREFLIEQMNLAGYDVRYKLLNAYDYGVPQNRERIFIIGAKDLSDFQWPQECRSQTMLLDYMDGMEHLRINAVRNSDPAINQAATGNRLTLHGERNEFFIFNDVRDGETVIHSWDIKELSKRECEICNTILKNRRSNKYGPKDGNPLSYQDLLGLIPNLIEAELVKLLDAGVIVRFDQGKYDFKNRRQLSGIDGVYRIFLPNARFFSTLTASGTPDLIATTLISANTDEEYRREFIEKIYNTKAYRRPTTREYARIQGFPDTHRLHSSDSANTKLIGNAVPPPLVKQVAQQLVKVLR